jgi:hypothetical protein
MSQTNCETHTQEIMTMRGKVHELASHMSAVKVTVDMLKEERVTDRIATLEATVWGANKDNGMKSELRTIQHNMTQFQQSFFDELDKRIERLNDDSEKRFEVNAKRLDKIEAIVAIHQRYVWVIGLILASAGYVPVIMSVFSK